MLERRHAIAILLGKRSDDLLIVSGLGSTTYDVASLGDDDRNFYLWGAMGAAAMVGLGLAVAQSKRRVLVVTGDGEMLMGLGALATIGLLRPTLMPRSSATYRWSPVTCPPPRSVVHTAGGEGLAESVCVAQGADHQGHREGPHRPIRPASYRPAMGSS